MDASENIAGELDRALSLTIAFECKKMIPDGCVTQIEGVYLIVLQHIVAPFWDRAKQSLKK